MTRRFHVTVIFERDLDDVEAGSLPKGWTRHNHDHRCVLVRNLPSATMGDAVDAVVDTVRVASADTELHPADAHARRVVE